MWEQIFNLAISNGLFAVMFLGLFIYQLKDSKSRESKYQDTIAKLGDSLQVVKEVKQDVEMIKEQLVRKSKKKNGVNENEK